MVVSLLVIVTAWLYWPTLSYPYVYEDLNQNHHFQQGWSGFVQEFQQTYRPGHLAWPARPLTEASYFLTHQVAHSLSDADHTVNVAIHLVTVAIVALIAMRLCGLIGGIVSVALFAWHPIQVEAIAYVSARADLLLGCGLACALAGIEYQRRWLLVMGCVIAIMSKEVGLMVPLAAGLYAAYIGHPWSRRSWTAMGSISALTASALLYGRFGSVRAITSVAFARHLSEFWSLLSRVITLSGFSVVHDYRWITGRVERVSVFALTVVVILAVWTRRPLPLSLVMMVILILPRLLFAVQYEPLHEHLLYQPMMALALGVGLSVKVMESRS